MLFSLTISIVFREYEFDILGNITFWPSVKLLVQVADPSAIKVGLGGFLQPRVY